MVFIVFISLDSDKVNMYGYMLEIFIVSNGVEFKCLLVEGEFLLEVYMDIYFEINENWIMVNSFNIGNYGGCLMN